MPENKGKPSGKYADKKSSPGRKGDYKRSGWPEEANTQRIDAEGELAGRNRKAGSPE
jgi:hypothetical protein